MTEDREPDCVYVHREYSTGCLIIISAAATNILNKIYNSGGCIYLELDGSDHDSTLKVVAV